jgi:hypothetical protein
MKRQICTAFSADETVDNFFPTSTQYWIQNCNFDFVTPFVCVFIALEGLKLRVLSVSLICPINVDNCMKMWYTELYAFPGQGYKNTERTESRIVHLNSDARKREDVKNSKSTGKFSVFLMFFITFSMDNLCLLLFLKKLFVCSVSSRSRSYPVPHHDERV